MMTMTHYTACHKGDAMDLHFNKCVNFF